jgi:hypothetical protein
MFQASVRRNTRLTNALEQLAHIPADIDHKLDRLLSLLSEIPVIAHHIRKAQALAPSAGQRWDAVALEQLQKRLDDLIGVFPADEAEALKHPQLPMLLTGSVVGFLVGYRQFLRQMALRSAQVADAALTLLNTPTEDNQAMFDAHLDAYRDMFNTELLLVTNKRQATIMVGHRDFTLYDVRLNRNTCLALQPGQPLEDIEALLADLNPQISPLLDDFAKAERIAIMTHEALKHVTLYDAGKARKVGFQPIMVDSVSGEEATTMADLRRVLLQPNAGEVRFTAVAPSLRSITTASRPPPSPATPPSPVATTGPQPPSPVASTGPQPSSAVAGAAPTSPVAATAPSPVAEPAAAAGMPDAEPAAVHTPPPDAEPAKPEPESVAAEPDSTADREQKFMSLIGNANPVDAVTLEEVFRTELDASTALDDESTASTEVASMAPGAGTTGPSPQDTAEEPQPQASEAPGADNPSDTESTASTEPKTPKEEEKKEEEKQPQTTVVLDDVKEAAHLKEVLGAEATPDNIQTLVTWANGFEIPVAQVMSYSAEHLKFILDLKKTNPSKFTQMVERRPGPAAPGPKPHNMQDFPEAKMTNGGREFLINYPQHQEKVLNALKKYDFDIPLIPKQLEQLAESQDDATTDSLLAQFKKTPHKGTFFDSGGEYGNGFRVLENFPLTEEARSYLEIPRNYAEFKGAAPFTHIATPLFELQVYDALQRNPLSLEDTKRLMGSTTPTETLQMIVAEKEAEKVARQRDEESQQQKLKMDVEALSSQLTPEALEWLRTAGPYAQRHAVAELRGGNHNLTLNDVMDWLEDVEYDRYGITPLSNFKTLSDFQQRQKQKQMEQQRRRLQERGQHLQYTQQNKFHDVVGTKMRQEAAEWVDAIDPALRQKVVTNLLNYKGKELTLDQVKELAESQDPQATLAKFAQGGETLTSKLRSVFRL